MPKREPGPVTGDELRAWMIRCQFDKSEAARRLGRSREQLYQYLEGKAEIPVSITLACCELRRRRLRELARRRAVA